MSIKVTQNILKIDLTEAIKKVTEKTGDECVTLIENSAPKDRPVYAKSWKKTMIDNETVIIHCKGKVAKLTHLLELGHRTRSGSYVPPQEHIRPSFNIMKKQYLSELKVLKIKTK